MEKVEEEEEEDEEDISCGGVRCLLLGRGRVKYCNSILAMLYSRVLLPEMEKKSARIYIKLHLLDWLHGYI
jgi:hypothetical protein